MLMQSPGEFVSSYGPIGAGKVQAKGIRLFLLAVLAGFLIGMGGAAAGTASFSLISPSLARLASGLLFPFGLITVVFTGAELFTGNCLITISVLSGQASLGGMVRNLCLVYLGNLVGASALAAGVVFSGQLDLSGGALAVSVIETAAAKCALSPGSAFLRGGCATFWSVWALCAPCAPRTCQAGPWVPSALCAFSWSAVLSTALPICIIYRLACLPGTFRNMRHWL